ncbi:TPA: hypothetical protein U1C15_001454 [Streptococcus suis]|nr:hypothetical protein [Streptococcus suis]
MNTDDLHKLSFDKTNQRYVIGIGHISNTLAYDLDEYAEYNAKKGCGLAYLTGDTHSTADALIDQSLIPTCNYLNFIEFKAGKMEYQKIRRKALESLWIYSYWQNLSINQVLSVQKQFILVHEVSNGNNKNNTVRNRSRRISAQDIIDRLKSNPIISEYYNGELFCYSGTDFETNFTSYLK